MVARTFALLAFALAASLGATAHAASVLINVVFQPGDSSYEIWAQASADNGNIALHAVGFTSMTLEPLPQISALDSPFVGNAASATLQVTSNQAEDLIPIGQEFIRLATLDGPGPVFTVESGDELFGYTVLNQDLDELIGWELYMNGTLVDSWEPGEELPEPPIPEPPLPDPPLPDPPNPGPQLPEPTTTALLGLALAALALARRVVA